MHHATTPQVQYNTHTHKVHRVSTRMHIIKCLNNNNKKVRKGYNKLCLSFCYLFCLYQTPCLSIFLWLSVYTLTSVCLSVSICLSQSVFLCLLMSLCVFLSLCLSSRSVSLFLYVLTPTTCLPAFPLSVLLSFSLFKEHVLFCLSLPVFLSDPLSLSLSYCLSLSLYISFDRVTQHCLFFVFSLLFNHLFKNKSSQWILHTEIEKGHWIS